MKLILFWYTTTLLQVLVVIISYIVVTGDQEESTLSLMSGRVSGSRNIATIAFELQERVTAFEIARDELNKARAELDQIESVASKEENHLLSTRTAFLEASRSRVDAELELYEAREQATRSKKSINALEHSKQLIIKETTSIQSQWEDEVKSVYSTHQADMDIYRNSLDGTIRREEENSKKRKGRLNELEDRTEALTSDLGKALAESMELESNISEIASSEGHENEEVSSLAKQIRDTLEKVRHSIRLLRALIVIRGS